MDNTTAFFLGILVTLTCSLIAFILSSWQLSKQVKRLVKLINLVLRGIEESGVAKFRRDENGEPIGMVFDMAIRESLHLSSSVTSHEVPRTKSKE